MMFLFDDKDIIRLERDLLRFADKALPIATVRDINIIDVYNMDFDTWTLQWAYECFSFLIIE